MSDISLVLSIADIPIVFYHLDDASTTYLRQYYTDYVADTSSGLSSHYTQKNAIPVMLAPFGIRRKQVWNEHGVYVLPVMPLPRHFRHFNGLLRGVISYELARRGGLLLHGAALVYKNEGYVFIGKEGAGKSTVRKLYRSLSCLGDDSALVRKIGTRWYVFGSPFYQRTYRSYPNNRVPLRGVFVLKKARHHSVQTLSFEEQIQALFSNIFTFGMGTRETELGALSASVFSLAHDNTVYSLLFKKEASFLPLLTMTARVRHIQKTIKQIIRPHTVFFRDVAVSRVEWQAGIADISLLPHVWIIREPSWNFEFQGKRSLEEIRHMVFHTQLDANHANTIRALSRKPVRHQLKNIFVLLQKQSSSKLVILDGNHHLCALYHSLITTRAENSFRFVSYVLGTTDNDKLYWV